MVQMEVEACTANQLIRIHLNEPLFSAWFLRVSKRQMIDSQLPFLVGFICFGSKNKKQLLDSLLFDSWCLFAALWSRDRQRFQNISTWRSYATYFFFLVATSQVISKKCFSYTIHQNPSFKRKSQKDVYSTVFIF